MKLEVPLPRNEVVARLVASCSCIMYPWQSWELFCRLFDTKRVGESSSEQRRRSPATHNFCHLLRPQVSRRDHTIPDILGSSFEEEAHPHMNGMMRELVKISSSFRKRGSIPEERICLTMGRGLLSEKISMTGFT